MCSGSGRVCVHSAPILPSFPPDSHGCVSTFPNSNSDLLSDKINRYYDNPSSPPCASTRSPGEVTLAPWKGGRLGIAGIYEEETSVMAEELYIGAAIVTIVLGVGTFFTEYSPFILMKRSTHRNLLSQRGSGQQNDNTTKNLDHITTADGRKWVWSKRTNNSNIGKHSVSFFEIAEAEIMSTSSEGINRSELKRSLMNLRGTPYYHCIYYEGEGYNRVFELSPPPDRTK